MKKYFTKLVVAFCCVVPAMLSGCGPSLGSMPTACMNAEQGLPQPFIVHFNYNSTELSHKDIRRLGSVAARARSLVRLCVLGKADKQGSASYNQKLALRRAQIVANVLAQNGVSPSSMIVDTLGEPFGRLVFEDIRPSAEDRRVEIRFIR